MHTKRSAMSACRRDAGARREGYARERRPRLRNEDRAGCLPAFKTAAPRGRGRAKTCSTGERTAASSASGAMEIAAGARRRLDVGQGGMTEGETFFVLYIIAIAFILAMLAGLMQLAHKRMVPKWRRRKHDEFRARNGHSWDYVLVFKVYDASEVLTKEQKKYSVRKVVERITSAGCETKMFFAVQRDDCRRRPAGGRIVRREAYLGEEASPWCKGNERGRYRYGVCEANRRAAVAHIT